MGDHYSETEEVWHGIVAIEVSVTFWASGAEVAKHVLENIASDLRAVLQNDQEIDDVLSCKGTEVFQD